MGRAVEANTQNALDIKTQIEFGREMLGVQLTIRQLVSECDLLRAELKAERKKQVRYETALKFYAVGDNYGRLGATHFDPRPEGIEGIIDDDHGEQARVALNPVPTEEDDD